MKSNIALRWGLICFGVAMHWSCAARQSTAAHPPAAVPPASSDTSYFPITPWETPWSRPGMLADPKVGVSSLRDCGFTTAAFVTESEVPLCEKLGLRAIVGPAAKEPDWKKMSDEQIEQAVRQIVGN